MKKTIDVWRFFWSSKKREREKEREREKNLVKGEVEPRLAKKRFVSSLSLETSALSLSLSSCSAFSFLSLFSVFF
jgi:hypothetical protein